MNHYIFKRPSTISHNVIPWDLLDAARRDVEKELTLSIKLVVIVVVN